MITLCYYVAIMLPFNIYYAAINLSCYYAAVMLIFKVYYAAIMRLLLFAGLSLNLCAPLTVNEIHISASTLQILEDLEAFTCTTNPPVSSVVSRQRWCVRRGDQPIKINVVVKVGGGTNT